MKQKRLISIFLIFHIVLLFVIGYLLTIPSSTVTFGSEFRITKIESAREGYKLSGLSLDKNETMIAYKQSIQRGKYTSYKVGDTYHPRIQGNDKYFFLAFILTQFGIAMVFCPLMFYFMLK